MTTVVPVPATVMGILRQLESAGHETWCVGGAIRDALLGDPQQDVDLATSALPHEIQKLFRRTVPVGVQHGTVGVLDELGVLHEVTTFRRDVRTDGRHAVVEFGVSLDEDLARRDFTINAIAYHPLRDAWRDPFDGRGALARREVRAVGDAAARFREDRLRILRGLRFAARFGFSIAPATWDAAIAQSADTRHLSAERVLEEWTKGLATARSLEQLAALWHDSGVASVWLPELRPVPPDGTWAVAREGPRDTVLLTALLAAPSASVWQRLKGSTADIRRAEALDAAPAIPAGSDPRSVRRWMAEVGAAASDLCVLARWRGADTGWVGTMQGIMERGEAVDRRQLAIRGSDLLAAGIAAGPPIGRTLDHLLQAVLDEPSLNERETLLELARRTP